MRKLRLLITALCDRACSYCCNKYYDLNALDTETNFTKYDEVMLTGGEPMLDPPKLSFIINRIKYDNPNAKIYLYTAKINKKLSNIIYKVDGVTITCHNQKDVKLFENFANTYLDFPGSLRVVLRFGLKIESVPINWDLFYKSFINKKYPLPKNEVFRKLPY